MGEYKLSTRSRIIFHPLKTLRRMNEITLGYEAANTYLHIEEDGLAIINALRKNTQNKAG